MSLRNKSKSDRELTGTYILLELSQYTSTVSSELTNTFHAVHSLLSCFLLPVFFHSYRYFYFCRYNKRSVFVGKDKQTGDIVALKRINTEQEANGFPITAIREVKILKALHHPNIVQLKELVTSKGALFTIFSFLAACLWMPA